MKLLFLDSNIFLSFYSFDAEDLNELGKLIDIITDGEIKLYLTKQVRNEVKKNREIKISEAYKQFNSSNITIKMPPICKKYGEYDKITKIQKLLEKIKLDLTEQLLEDIRDNQLKADLLIDRLFDVADFIDTDDYLKKAIIRHKTGKPPGKKNKSYGDEINWEALLDTVSIDGDFILISKDGDFHSPIDTKRLNEFLIEEWQKNKKTNIFIYQTLGGFFSEHDINIQLIQETEKDELIEDLINSGSFLSTHEIIRRLSKYNSFSEEQVRGLGTALLGNSQVHWITDDKDIRDFYDSNLKDKSDLFDKETWKEIKHFIFDSEKNDVDDEIEKLFNLIKEKENAGEEINPDDIPF